jgi:hypothetical protein
MATGIAAVAFPTRNPARLTRFRGTSPLTALADKKRSRSPLLQANLRATSAYMGRTAPNASAANAWLLIDSPRAWL